MVTEPTFQFLIDWDNDNDFSDFYEDISEYVRSAVWSIGMSQPYQLVGDEMRLELSLNNHDKRFSPDNTSSPYYEELVPRRRIKIISSYEGTERTMYLGYIDSIEVDGGDGKMCLIRGASAKRWMQDQLISLPLQVDKRTDEVLEKIIIQLQNPAAMGDDA